MKVAGSKYANLQTCNLQYPLRKNMSSLTKTASSATYKFARLSWHTLKRLLPSTYAQRLFHTDFARRLRGAPTKRDAHFLTWLEKYERNGGTLAPLTDNYRQTITGAGNISDLSFFDDKIVLDVGSGPACTLCWIPNARARIGLDPLAARFMELGIGDHDMLYLNAPGERIPLPSAYVDVVISINALDHVEDPVAVMKEIDRITRPGGHFIGSIGLRQRPTFTEPHVLTKQLFQTRLFRGWHEEFSKIRPKGPTPGEFYRFFQEDPPPGYQAKEMLWWCRYRKPAL